MKRYTMFLDWKNQHCETDYTTQSNLQIQCNTSQITNGILHRIRIKIFAMFMETQKTMLAKAILKKKKRELEQSSSWLHTILQSYSNHNSMVLAQKTEKKVNDMG